MGADQILNKGPAGNKASGVRELCPLGNRKEARWLVPGGEGEVGDRMLKG